MKLTWLTARHPPDKGGMATSSKRLVNSLRDRGHALQVIHLQPMPSQPVSSASMRLQNWNRTVVAGMNAPSEPQQLFWTFRRSMLDSVIIGFGGGKPGYLATLWATWLNVPSVVLFRGNDFEKIIHDTKHGWMIHFILDQADIVGAVSREMVARIRSLRNGQTVFTPNGIDTTEWYLEKIDHERAQQWRMEHVPDDKRVIGMFGQLKFKKGLEMAVALLTTLGFHQHACLLTVGDVSESMQESLEAGCAEHWIHVPFQPQEILPVYYAAADVVFMPSLYDGMPNVLLEAMALGKNVVASNAGGIPDVISDGVNGFLFEIGDYSGAARAMNKALTLSQDQKALMGKEARRTVEESFTSAREVEILDKIFYNLCPRSPERRDHGL